MITTLKNPEIRQPRGEFLNDNCRPSGLSGKRDQLRPTRTSQSFSFFTISDITKDGAIKRWVVLSSGRRSVLIRYLFLKFIYDELTQEEYKLFLSFNETTSSIPIYFALKARLKRIPKKTIRLILETITFPGFKIMTREEYQGLRQIKFSFSEKQYPPIKKPKPYSGYSKGFKDGKRRSKFQVVEFNSTPLEPGPLFEDEINLLINFTLEIKSNPRKLIGMLHNFRGESNEF